MVKWGNVVIVLVLRVLLALTFLVFGAVKMIDPHSFVQNVSNFQISPFDRAPYDMWLAYFLPPLEVVVAISLLSKRWLVGALLISAGMVLAFMVAIGSVWARGLNIGCGCSAGTVSLGGYSTHMLFLSGMLGASVYLIIDHLFSSGKT